MASPEAATWPRNGVEKFVGLRRDRFGDLPHNRLESYHSVTQWFLTLWWRGLYILFTAFRFGGSEGPTPPYVALAPGPGANEKPLIVSAELQGYHMITVTSICRQFLRSHRSICR